MQVIRLVGLLLGSMLLAAALSQPAHAGLPETPRPRQLTVADGLPSNRINGLTEDKLGYLWIATSDGLARYDGLDYRVWRAEQGLRDNFVWAVHVDARNRVWVGTSKAGLAMLDADRNEFRYFNTANTPGIGSDDIWSITSTADGVIWFGTADGGLHRLAEDGQVTRFLPRAGDSRSLPSASVGQLLVTHDGTLWVGTKNGVARWTGHDFERLPASALNSVDINGLSAEDDGTLWIGTPRGVSVRRPDGSHSSRPWGEHQVLHVLHRDHDGSYWLDIPEGLGRDNDGGIDVVPLYSQASRGTVRPPWVSAYEDREGGLWLASNNNGLWYLPPNWRKFSILSRQLGAPASLANAHVRGIAGASDGQMWLVGSGGMLDRLDPETGRVEHVAKDIGSGLVLSSVFEDAGGHVWVGFSDGVARMDAANGRMRKWGRDDLSDPALAGETIGFAQTRDGLVWMAAEGSGLQARDATGRVRHAIVPGDGHGLDAGTAIEQVGRAPDGTLWVASSQGLSAWNADTRRLEPVRGAPRETILGHAFDAEGKVWIARAGVLESYRWQGARLAREFHMDAGRGFPQIAPSGLTVDAAGIVWLTSVRGIIRVDPGQGTVRVYGVRGGLPSQEFGHAPVSRLADGRILAGTPEGLVLFDPAAVKPSTEMPHLVIENIRVRRGAEWVGFAQGKSFRLEHGDRDLQVVARLLSFNDARTHAYRFRLSRHDTGWVDAGAGGERTFSHLEPGHYRLEVQARNADNVWSQAQSIEFGVAPPWWRTPAAVAGFAGLLLLLGWWAADVYRARMKRWHAWQLAQHEREIAEQASLAKTRFLATLGHEVRTPMTGVLGMTELLLDTSLDRQQRGYTESIRRAGEHLLRLVNDALDLARIESGKLELKEEAFDLRALVDEAAALMAPLARQKGLAFEVDLAPDAPHGLHGDASRVCQILLNLLSNAIKFTEAGRVSLCVMRGDMKGLRFEVADTGPGLNDEQKTRLFRRFEQADGARTTARYGGSGLGLAICQELAATMGGQIAVESTPGAGTRFSVELPLAPAILAVGAAQSTAKPVLPTAQSLVLLLVEDDATVAEVITGLLQAQGHRVVHAGHALTALAEAATNSFDVALLDLDLPGMDGLTLACQLRAQGFTAPLIAVTARADADAEPQACVAGFDRFVRKPVTAAMLARMLDDVVVARSNQVDA